MKGLFLGIALILLLGVGGLIYRNAISRPLVASGACTADAKVCPDGSAVGRVAPDCNFAACPPPNITLGAPIGIVFDLPAGYASTTLPDADSIAAYASEDASVSTTASSTEPDELVIKDYPIPSGEEASDVMHATAILDTSGNPASPSSFSAVTLGGETFTMVVIGEYQGVVHVAYYLPRTSDVLRFDSIDQGVSNWSDPALNIATLPADSALRTMLSTLETN
jgi:hypothetical protein